MIFCAWFDHLEKHFSDKEVEFLILPALLLKTLMKLLQAGQISTKWPGSSGRSAIVNSPLNKQGLPFSPTKGNDHVKTSMKFGSQ